MKKIQIENLDNDNYNYFLLDSKQITENDAKSLLFKLTGEKTSTIINENGIKASENGIWVVKRNSGNNKFVNLINFENDNDFIYLE